MNIYSINKNQQNNYIFTINVRDIINKDNFNKDGLKNNIFSLILDELKNEINFIKDKINENKKNYLTKESITALKVLEKSIDYFQSFIIPFSISSFFLSLPIAVAIGYAFLIFKFANNNFNILNKIISKISEKLQLNKINNILNKIGNLISYIPLYPTIKASINAKNQIIKTLDKLPLKTINKASIIEINNEINDKYDALGVTFNKITYVPIYLHSNPHPYTLEYVLTHELGHTNDFFNNIPLNYKSSILGLVPKFPFGFNKFVSDYAATKAAEDFAESFAYYYLNPNELKQTAPIKYYIIHFYNKTNFLEKIFDNKYIREIIKKISLIIPEPIRIILNILSFKSTTSSMKENISKLVKSNNENDFKSYINAKLNLLTTLLLINKSIYSIYTIPLKYGINKLVEKKIINENFANKLVNLVLSYTIGPLGTTIAYFLNSKNNKKEIALTGIANIIIFNLLKFLFPYLIPILIPLEKLSTFASLELVNKLNKK
ncbi:MAG: hypothetical protein N2485_03510 [bacterium]|nr:hypothetical protein [bacterium]